MRQKLLVIVPAYRGANSLPRSLRSLAAQRFPKGQKLLRPRDVEVAIAVNDGRQDTLAAAQNHEWLLRERGYTCRILTTPPGRRNAFNAAEATADAKAHRLYLDQDAKLSADVLMRVAAALQPGSGIHFAAPRAEFERSRSWAVRAYCRYWNLLPYVTRSPVTMGAFAVSSDGRRRWGRFPAIEGDDKYVRLLFSPEERLHLPEVSYCVLPTESWGDLISARRRYYRMNREIANARELVRRDSVRRYRGSLAPARDPRRWPDFGVFMVTFVIAAALELFAFRSARQPT